MSGSLGVLVLPEKNLSDERFRVQSCQFVDEIDVRPVHGRWRIPHIRWRVNYGAGFAVAFGG